MYYQEDNEKYLAELLELIQKNAIIPFIGAGMSSPTFPTWKDYLKQIPDPGDIKAVRKIMDWLDEDICDYEAVVQYLYERYGLTFLDRTREAFDSRKIVPERINPAAYAIPILFEGPIITTNLDQLLEWLYRDGKVPLPVGLAGETGFINERMIISKPCLWKIHGDVDKSDAWVLTKDQYENLYEHGNVDFLEVFNTFLQYKVLLFLGASLVSDKIVSLLEDLFRRNNHIRHYAILPAPEEDDAYYDELSRFRNLGINPIWYPKGDYDAFAEIVWGIVERSGKRFSRSYLPPDCKMNPPAYITKNKELEAIDTKFSESNFVTLQGITGIGKTQLAISYLSTISRNNVIFIKCSTWETFHQSLHDFLVWDCRLPREGGKPVRQDYQKLFADALAERNNVLVVFDDVNDDDILKYIASLPANGRYLITTRRKELKTLSGTWLEVEAVGDEEAYRILRSWNLKVNAAGDKALIEELNRFCGGIPLALDQASAYMSATGEDLQNYLKQIKSPDKKKS